MSYPVTANRTPPIHPGELLREILEDAGLSQASLARNIGVSPMRISHLIRETRPVTADMALRLGLAFGQSPEFWMGLQNDYDLKVAERKLRRGLAKIQPLAA